MANKATKSLKKIGDKAVKNWVKSVKERQKKAAADPRSTEPYVKKTPGTPTSNWRGLRESETSPLSKAGKHDELAKMIAKWRKKGNKIKVANAKIGKGTGMKKRDLRPEKAKLVGEEKRAIVTNSGKKLETYSMDEIRSYIKKALKATRHDIESHYSTHISDNPKPGDRLYHGEKVSKVLTAIKKSRKGK